MQRTSLVGLVIVILVTLAGCNAFSSGSNTPMVTPMDVPTDAPTPTVTPRATRQLPAQCSPGLTALGVPNASVLAAAHTATLRNTSFTMRASSTRIAQNGSILKVTHTTAYIAQNDSQLYFIWEWLIPQSPPAHYDRKEFWTNGERTVRRVISGYRVSYGMVSRDFRSLAQNYASRPRYVLDNATACVADQVPHNETTLFVVAFTRPRPPPGFIRPNATSLGNVTGRALVGSSGSVYELRWHYTVRTPDGAVVTVTRRTSYTDIGTTTVERPLWYAKAVKQPQPTNRTTAAG